MEKMNVNHLDQVTKSITPSGFFGTSKDNIVELENFMTEEEIDFLEKSAKGITIWDIQKAMSMKMEPQYMMLTIGKIEWQLDHH